MKTRVCGALALALFLLPAVAFGHGRHHRHRGVVESPTGAPAEAVRALVSAAASAAGIPAALAHAVVRVESGYRASLRGSAGEWGLGQIKCATAREVGFGGRCGDLAQPETNLRFSMAYLRRALDRGGSGCAGISLYNRGLYARPACTGYGRRVLAAQ